MLCLVAIVNVSGKFLITYIYIHLPVKLVSYDHLMSHLDPERLHWMLCSVMEGTNLR